MVIEDCLKSHFQLPAFRKGQREIITSVMENRDTLAIMPTGGGKSLCYQLPAIAKDGLVIVVTPLISLMKDQVRSLRDLGIAAGCLHSQQGYGEKRELFREMESASKFLLYLSPERIQKEGFAKWLSSKKPVLFAIDEAHCVSQWGHDFREDYNRLSLLREIAPEVPILALTATATPQVASDIAKRLTLKDPDRHVYGFYRPNLYYQVRSCSSADDKLEALVSAVNGVSEGRVLVYCGTRGATEELCHQLSKFNPKVGYYHAGMDSTQRTEVQGQYDSGEIRILCATNAFGMGIDHPDVRLIVHYQLPANLESYYQEIGRAGRDGKESTCLLLYAKKDKGLQSFFITQSTAPKSIISYRWRALDAIVQYAEGGECRHSGILTYFRDAQRIDECGHCDICAPNSNRRFKFAERPSAKFIRKKRGTAKTKTPILDDGPVSPEIEARMKQIRQWRTGYAKAKDIPAFMVFSNKTLKDLAMKAPSTQTDLLKVYGLGEHKVDEFGSELLDLM